MGILKQIMSSHAHWQINKDFARKWGLDAAVLAMDLVDKWLYFDSEWFYNSSEDIEKNTTLSYYKQKKALTLLEENGFIETELRGIPATLHFSIDEQRFIDFFNGDLPESTLKQDLEKLQNLNLKNSKTGIQKTSKLINNNKRNNNKRNNNKELNYILSSEEKKPISQLEKNKDYIPIAKDLADIVTSSKNINIPKSKINNWANSIRLLNTTDGVSMERIETALQWYEKNHGGDYIPVIESGQSLRSKFLKLEAAIQRSSNKRFRTQEQPANYTPREQIIYRKSRRM